MTSLVEQKQELLQLLTSDDFAELSVKSKKQFNIFQVLNLQNNEVKHSNFLGWLLTPFESHNLMDRFLKELLKIALRNDTSLVDILLKDLTNAKITLEKMTNDGKRMDIFIDCPKNKLVCVIENKVRSGEGCNQLKDYRDYVLNHDKYKDYKHKIFLFLTPYNDATCENYKGYIRINYGDILKAINNLMKEYGCLLDDDVKIFIEHYKRMVERDIMGHTDEKIVQLCRKIYREHKNAIDLINKHSDSRAEIFEILQEVLNERKDIEITEVGTSNIKFIPKGIDNINKLKELSTDSNSISQLQIINFVYRNMMYIEITVGAIDSNNIANAEKRNKLKEHLLKEVQISKFNGKTEDWSYTPSECIMTMEDYFKYENKEELKKFIADRLNSLQDKYIVSYKNALNSWNPEK